MPKDNNFGGRCSSEAEEQLIFIEKAQQIKWRSWPSLVPSRCVGYNPCHPIISMPRRRLAFEGQQVGKAEWKDTAILWE